MLADGVLLFADGAEIAFKIGLSHGSVSLGRFLYGLDGLTEDQEKVCKAQFSAYYSLLRAIDEGSVESCHEFVFLKI